MPTTYAIPDGRTAMAATTWTGDGLNPRSITNTVNGVSFQPDLVWAKLRSGAASHNLYDSVRGVGNVIYSDLTATEANNNPYGYLTAFNSNGFSSTTGSTSNAYFNANGSTYVGWQWKANGTAVTNTAGSITSQVSANTTSGFSVVTYTGNLTTVGTATVGHGLGVAPAMIIFKGRNATTSWPVFHTSLTSWNWCCILDGTNAQIDQTGNGSMSAPTSTVFSTNWTTGMNTNGTTEVAYCFAPVAGYSAFGKYTGNGSADGPFVYLGFRPRFVLVKDATSAGGYWEIHDTSRSTYNSTTARLWPNVNSAEATGADIDFLSNGFKIRTTDGTVNNSGSTIIYAAFAENPFKYANAR
jgi:hypothetical protein